MIERRGFRRFSLAGLLAAALAAGGCVAKTGLVSQVYAIDPPRRVDRSASATAVLALRPVYVASVYADTSLIYRVGDHRIERDPYAYWGASPGQMLTAAALGYLRNSGFVRDVILAGEGLSVNAIVEPSVSEFCGDFSDPSQATAVLSMQFRVLAPASGASPAREILLQNYRQSVPVTPRTAQGVAAALNQALADVMKQFLGDLEPILTPR